MGVTEGCVMGASAGFCHCAHPRFENREGRGTRPQPHSGGIGKPGMAVPGGPDVSKMLRGEFRQFSVERLLRFLLALDQDVGIVVKPHRDRNHAPALQVF